MKTVILAISVLFLSSTLAFSASLYTHDKNGNHISGDINDLIDAAKDGRQIVVGYGDRNLHWLRTCEHVSIQDDVVSCYVMNVIDTKAGGGSRTFDKSAVEVHIYDTTGYIAGLKRDFYTGAQLPIIPPNHKRTLRWYAR